MPQTYVQTTRQPGPATEAEIFAGVARRLENAHIKAGDFVLRYNIAPRFVASDATVRTFFPVVVVWIDRTIDQAEVEHPDGRREHVSPFFLTVRAF